MIFAPHIVIGAAIGAKTQNLGLIIILGLLSHWILDRIPHWDYDISKNVGDFRSGNKNKGLLGLSFKIFADGIIGFLIILIPIIYYHLFNFKSLLFIFLGIFFSVLPDIVLGLILLFSSNGFLKKYFEFHNKYLHNKKEGTPTLFRILMQILITTFSLLVFFV